MILLSASIMNRRKLFMFLCNTKMLNEIKSRMHSLITSAEVQINKTNDVSSNVSVSKIKNVLKKSGYDFIDGFTCISTNCRNCNTNEQGTIYINKVTGFFLCTECQECGNWETIKSKISTETKTSAPEPKSETLNLIKKSQKYNKFSEVNIKWNELIQSCKNVTSLTETNISNIISLFDLPNFSNFILKELNVLFDESKKILYFPLTSGGRKKLITGIKELAKSGNEACYPPMKCCGILKYVPNGVTKKECIIVHNIHDFLALASCKLKYHLVCLPHGIVMLPQEILPLVEHYKKLILWFGNDRIKLDAALMFSKKLGNERCSFIRLTDKSPATYITDPANQDIRNIIKSARPIIHESITTFSSLKEDVWLELTNKDNAQGIKWKRFPVLNELLRGHRRGELTILTGPTGCGKTTFISEYSLDLAMQGVCTLWGSFEIRNQRLAFTMLQQLSTVPLDDNLDQFEHWATEFEKLPIYFLKFHGQQPIRTVMDVVEHAAYVHDIQHVIIDNLQFMMGLTLDGNSALDRFFKQDKIIDSFRTFATLRNCHVTLIIHPRKEKEADDLSITSIFGSAKASQEADNILIIQKKMYPSLQIKKYVQVVKNRYCGDLGIMPLEFNKSLLSFQSKSKEKLKQANKNQKMT